MPLIIVTLLLGLLGAGLMTAGVSMLLGTGCALLAGGAFALGAAVVCRNGMTPNG